MQRPMRRIDIVTPRATAPEVTRVIHRAGIVHLAPFDPPSRSGSAVFHAGAAAPSAPGSDADRFDDATETLTSLAGLLSLPPPDDAVLRVAWTLPDDDLLARVAGLEPVRREAAERSADIVRLGGEADRLAGYRQIIEGLRRAIGHLPAVRGYGSTGIVLRSRYRAVVGLVREELEVLTGGRCEVLAADIDAERTAAVLIYPMRSAAEVRAMLGGRDLEEVTLPESLAAVPFDALVPRLSDEEAGLRAELAECRSALGRLSAVHGPTVAALRAVVTDRIAEARVIAEAGRSDHLTVVSGWLPADRVAELRARLAEVGPAVLVLDRPADPMDRRVPVVLDDRPVIRAFEPLASFVAMPRYGTVDPTPAVAFVFPLFVGLMVGDIGYGLLLLALLVVARWRWGATPAMRILWPVGVLAATSTIVFGVLFGELLGDIGHEALGLEPLWLDRRDALVPLLILAIAIGAAQIGLGLVLGIVNASRLRHRREALGRAALLAGLASGTIAIGALTGLVPGPLGGIAVAVLLGSLVVMTASLGLAGPIEMMGLVGNVLSYARLMAIGLASVMLAFVANRMGGLTGDLVLGLVIAALFHGLAFALGFFDASVQGLRLQYVEFFSKFVEPGGVRYEPFVGALRDRDDADGGRPVPTIGGA